MKVRVCCITPMAYSFTTELEEVLTSEGEHCLRVAVPGPPQHFGYPDDVWRQFKNDVKAIGGKPFDGQGRGQDVSGGQWAATFYVQNGGPEGRWMRLGGDPRLNLQMMSALMGPKQFEVELASEEEPVCAVLQEVERLAKQRSYLRLPIEDLLVLRDIMKRGEQL